MDIFFNWNRHSYLTKVPAQGYLIQPAQSVSALGVCRTSNYNKCFCRGCLLGERL
uniref:Uncharacterized protein n=1 Tax=Triticum urartu TaxID=4572 RepID=A0A8R7K3U1_TRIUA